ncbi:hypothetical protein Syun_006036 [Stephania yunnanensis]|uniref:Uncharacterized protein n=1 Tax=Stephania yunnanensis TaxID=152371 RepID=A0AAP0KWW5_9MAGN
MRERDDGGWIDAGEQRGGFSNEPAARSDKQLANERTSRSLQFAAKRRPRTRWRDCGDDDE